MPYFKCESCGAVPDVPYVGWHFVARKAGHSILYTGGRQSLTLRIRYV